MGRSWLLLAVVGCAGCAAPRTYFQQPRLVVGASEAEWAAPDSLGANLLRGMARQSAHTLIWEGLEGAGLLDGVSLGEVDAGLVRDTAWDPSASAADWIEVGASRNGYRLLVARGAGLQSWLVRWGSTPMPVLLPAHAEPSDVK